MFLSGHIIMVLILAEAVVMVNKSSSPCLASPPSPLLYPSPVLSSPHLPSCSSRSWLSLYLLLLAVGISVKISSVNSVDTKEWMHTCKLHFGFKLSIIFHGVLVIYNIIKQYLTSHSSIHPILLRFPVAPSGISMFSRPSRIFTFLVSSRTLDVK